MPARRSSSRRRRSRRRRSTTSFTIPGRLIREVLAVVLVILAIVNSKLKVESARPLEVPAAPGDLPLYFAHQFRVSFACVTPSSSARTLPQEIGRRLGAM